MANYPTECTVCNSVALAVQKDQGHQLSTAASVDSLFVSTTFHVQCIACGNQWLYSGLVGC
jgi:hypothetical protein